MQRHQFLAFVVAAVAAVAGASVFMLGTAQAATWHDYKGDLYPGHAYGLQVPDQADAVEILLEGDAATAALALYDPAGIILAYHELDAANPAVTLEAPAEGRYVVYVYSLEDGALKVRVNALLAPLTANLQQMPLYKEEVSLTVSDGAAPLDLVKKLDLKSTPAFVTLLYEGSVRGLDATIASPKGDVLAIAGESGVAFAPGVWSSISGERASVPKNLDGLQYTVKAAAEKFEGSLVLTSLTIDHTVAPEAPDAPPAAPAAPPLVLGTAFTAPEGKAMAFQATKGSIRVTNVEPVVEKDSDAEREREPYWSAGLSIYAPDDSLLAYVELDRSDPNATIKLPADGEYVVFVHHASDKGLLVQLVGATTASSIRALPLAKEEFVLELGSGLYGEAATFALAHVPVALDARLSEDAMGALSWVRIVNDNGEVAGVSTFVRAPGVDVFDWSHESPANFAMGEHALEVQGVMEGSLTLVSHYFLRSGEAPPPAAAPTPATTGLVGLLDL